MKLPVRLGKSPLVDAVFELRVTPAGMPLNSVLGGLLFSNLNCSNIERMPSSEIPEVIRGSDPGLKYAVLSRLTWDGYYIGVGDNVITLHSCDGYKGWSEFEDRITKLLSALKGIRFIGAVERCSLKYVDILNRDIHEDVISSLAVKIDFGGLEFLRDTFSSRFELPFSVDGCSGVHIVSVAGRAKAITPDNKKFEGAMVDVDSIVFVDSSDVSAGILAVSAVLEGLHLRNKELFFGLLTDKCLERMEPFYD